MIPPSRHPQEHARLQALRARNQLDTPRDARFERLATLTQSLLEAPIAAISLVDRDRQWFRAIRGLDLTSTPRDEAFCAHAILQDRPLIVPDASADPRFVQNPFVTGRSAIRSYASVPLKSPGGMPIGALCVMDQSPRAFSAEHLETLRDLALITEAELAAPPANPAQAELLASLKGRRRKQYLDPLTNVWNRAGVESLLDLAVTEASELAFPHTLILIDVGNVPEVEQMHGVPAAREFVLRSALTILHAVRDEDCLGRLGRGCFVVVPAFFPTLENLMLITSRIRRRFQEKPIAIRTGQVTARVDLGAAFLPAGTPVTPHELLEVARAALQHARVRGTGFEVFSKGFVRLQHAA